MDAIQEQKIDQIFSLWQEYPGAGGQLVVVHKGQTVLEKCYGYQDIEKEIPMTQDSVFIVASVSKQLTAMSILLLHDRGLLDINDDVSKYIPEMKLEGPVTISHMLHHTSGLRENLEMSGLAKKAGAPAWRQKDLVAISTRQTKLNFASGTEFTYINSNYTLMAEIVERVSGMSFLEFTKKNIFEPLGMENSFFRDDPNMDFENRVRGYHDDGYEYWDDNSNSCFYGSGGLRTTCRDLVKFMPEYVKPTLLSEKTAALRLEIPPLADGTVTNYACGVRINELLGHKYYHHGGVTSGFRAFSVIFPEDDLVIAVATNTYNIPIETAGRDVARVILGLPEREKKNLDAYTTEGVSLEEIPGYYYRDTVARRYDVKVEDGEVFVHCNGRWTKLQPIGGNLYKMGRRNITFAFGEKPAVNQEEAVMELRKLTAQVTAENVQAYLGTYYAADVDNTLSIELCEGELWLALPNGVRQKMVCLEDEVFCCGSMAGKRHLAFTRDGAGKVVGLEYRSNQIRKMIYEKI